jgi:hypothetical protein
MMSENELKAELFARGKGICRGTIFSGKLLGQTHSFVFSQHSVRVRLPSTEFHADSNLPAGGGANVVHFRKGYTNDPNLDHSFYELSYIIVEIDFNNIVNIPHELLNDENVKKSHLLINQAPHMERLSQQYDGLLISAWRHWLRIARWATNQYDIGCSEFGPERISDLEMPRIHEKVTGYGVWASTSILELNREAEIDCKQWEHIGKVLRNNDTPPIWFEYLGRVDKRLQP